MGGGGHGRGTASGIRQEGRGQRDADERNDHKNTLPLGGRVEGHIRLYREMGRGGGAEIETGTKKNSTRAKSVDKSRRA